MSSCVSLRGEKLQHVLVRRAYSSTSAAEEIESLHCEEGREMFVL